MGAFNTQDLRESLKALLPNASINFAPSMQNQQALQQSRLRNNYMQQSQQAQYPLNHSCTCLLHSRPWLLLAVYRSGFFLKMAFSSSTIVDCVNAQGAVIVSSQWIRSDFTASWNGSTMQTQLSSSSLDDQFADPAIVSGCLSTDSMSRSPPSSQPHWIKSIQQLTETDTTPARHLQQNVSQSMHSSQPPSATAFRPNTHSRMPFAQNMHINQQGWPL